MINKKNIIIVLSVVFVLILQYRLNEINLMYLKRDYDLRLSAIQQKIELRPTETQPVAIVTVEPVVQPVTTPTTEPIAQSVTIATVEPVVQPVTQQQQQNNLSMPQIQPVQPIKIYNSTDLQMSASATDTSTLTLSEIWTTAKAILIDLGLWYPTQVIVSIGFVVIIAFIILSYFKP